MKAAKRFEGLAKAIVLGLIVATFVFAPLGVIPVSADGGSNGQPGEPPPDTVIRSTSIGDPSPADETLLTTTCLTILRFVVL